MTVHLADLSREQPEVVVVRLQNRQRRLRFFVEELAARSDWIKGWLDRFDQEVPQGPGPAGGSTERGCAQGVGERGARRRAFTNDQKVWARSGRHHCDRRSSESGHQGNGSP